MADLLLSVVAGAVAGLVLCLLLFRRHLTAPPSGTTTPATAAAEPASLEEIETPLVAEEVEPPVEPAATAALLPSLGRTLFPLAEAIGHPGELPAMPEFQAVVAAFRRDDATLALLGDYAMGGNWPMACAAFMVLAEHPARQSLAEPVLRHIPQCRPYVLMYALRFLSSLDRRPPVGAPLLGMPPWWPGNPVIPGFFREYFARGAELGDPPDFGDRLERGGEFAAEPVAALLQKVNHPVAAQLLAVLRRWEGLRIDRTYLATIGVVWDPAEQDPLLVAPAAWEEPLLGAETVIRQARPRSILVTGDPRTGKTAFLKLLGGRLQRAGWTIFAASGNELQADQVYIGELEGRIRKLVEALHARRKIVWYVGDLHQLATSGTHRGQSATILDQILPAVTAGHLIVVGETSGAVATRLLQARPSLRSVIEILRLEPMEEDATLALARAVGERITRELGIRVSDQAVSTTMDLAEHYLGTGQLPGAVLELLKRAAGRSAGAGETELTADSVVATLSQISGLPTVILDTSRRVELAQVRAFFADRVIGQDEAVKAVVDRIAMLKAGLTDSGRPIGVFLFAGPTGTGKTELAKTLAEYLFGSADRMTRLDMSEFQTPEAMSKIIGQRGDGMADSLIDRVRKQPFSVVLLDEFEKAHASCWDLFLQIFDDGRLTDANGKEADFRHCFIILTSNLGATAHQGAGLGFRPDPGTYGEDQVLRTIGQTFRPEFINRLDRIIVFRPLSRELMRDIVHKELARVQERRGLRERAWAVEWEASAIEFLLDRGFSPEMGARPLKRAIDQLLLAPLAATLVEHRFPEGDQFLFVRSNGKAIEVEFVDPDAEPANDAAPEAEPDDDLSLAAIVLRQTGSPAERATLTAHWREVADALAGDTWRAAADALRLELADPAIWQRADRFRIFSKLELIDRVGEAARTAERLYQRYASASEHTARASRELAGRLALQLLNVRNGMDDVATDAPIDALLRVEPALDAAGGDGNAGEWCRTLTDMYRHWAARRRMQLREIAPADAASPPILHVTGFGAWRILDAEIGLHVLEDQTQDNPRRTVARVTMVAGPEQDLAGPGEHAAAADLLAARPAGTTIIRRYRLAPSPMVRDVASGWRTGRLDTVLGGDFDLMAAIKGRQAVA